jgi:hypothetical protein
MENTIKTMLWMWTTRRPYEGGPAGPNGIWDGAPQVFKDRVMKKGSKGGKGKGKGMQRNLGKR